jgi:Fe-Mn family superoxide dismutase
MMTRRHALKTTTLAAVGFAINGARAQTPSPQPPAAAAAPTVKVAGPYVLPPLPYNFNALEPHIDAQTMEIHHGKHHFTYVANLNNNISAAPELGKKPVEELLRDLNSVPENIRTAVRNFGGGHANHTLFWHSMAQNPRPKPIGALAAAIEKKWGDYAAFQTAFTAAATSLFGSGWVWLTLDNQKQLRIETTANQDSPLSLGRTPLFCLDVWEHAYYLKYQNRRPLYVAAFFNVVNWGLIVINYMKLMA